MKKTKEKEIKELEDKIEKKKKYAKGVSYNSVIAVNKNEIEEVIVGDELGCDNEAWELVKEYKANGYKVKMVHLKDVIFN